MEVTQRRFTYETCDYKIAKNYKVTHLMTNYKVLAQALVLTPSRHPLDIFQTPSRYPSDTLQTLNSNYTDLVDL